MGFRQPVKRSTLADANEGRYWHIWEDLAIVLIRRARKLYCNDSFGIELGTSAYALDAMSLASRIVLQVDQAASAYQAIYRQQLECSEDANLVRHRHLRTDCHC